VDVEVGDEETEVDEVVDVVVGGAVVEVVLVLVLVLVGVVEVDVLVGEGRGSPSHQP
jgi:hypothetical protein